MVLLCWSMGLGEINPPVVLSLDRCVVLRLGSSSAF